MSFDLETFTLRDRLSCSAGLVRATQGAETMGTAAAAAARFLHANAVVGTTGELACEAVLFYQTRPAEGGTEYRSQKPREIVRVGLAGDPAIEQALERLEPAQPRSLADPTFAGTHRLVAHLCHQLGLAVTATHAFSPEVQRTPEGKKYAVLHVRDVADSRYVSGIEELLVPHGVRSVLAFGGLLTRGDVVVAVLYSRVRISDDTAELFRTIALDLTALFRSHEGNVFAG